jgi:4-amino-4-deoxy-L-arabinose transferase-like glycosyltransferase
LILAAIIGSSWYVAMERSQPGFLRYYFFDRHVLGFLSDSQPHGGSPWWYYIPVLIVGGFPWIAYLPVLGWARSAEQGAGSGEQGRAPCSLLPAPCSNRPMLLLGCWLVGGTLFLSISSAKFVTYIWPVFPALAILAAIVWERKIDGSLGDRASHWMGRIVWCTCLIGPLGLPTVLAITQIALPARFSPLVWALAAAAALTSLAPLVSWLRGRVRLTLGLAATTVCAQLIVLLLFVFPQVAAGLSGRDLADYFNRTGDLPGRMLMVEEQLGSAVFYLRPDLRSQLQPGQIPYQNINDPLVPARKGTVKGEGGDWIVVPERHLQKVLGKYDLAAAPYERACRFRLYRRSVVEPAVLVGRAARPTEAGGSLLR